MLAAIAASAPASAQTVATDKLDYYPGETVIVTGTGWLPGERVSLFFSETPYQFVPLTLYADADSTGAIYSDEYVIQPYHLGTSFVLTAYGLTSELMAQTTFTDSPKVGSVVAGAQSAVPCAGTSGQATYTVTVSRGSGSGSSGNFTATLSVTSGLPAGVSAAFSPNPVQVVSSASSASATMTLTTSAGTPSGTSTITVKAATSATDTAATSVTFTVNRPPSITSPGNQTVNNAAGQCGATVSFAANATGSPTPTVTYSQNPGTVFPVGVTTVTATATNACGSANTTFTVTVNDTEKPAITTSSLTASTAGACGATIASLGTTASDNCPGVTLAGVRSDAAPLAALFPVGTTTITWTATDAHGNTQTATQTVTIQDHENPVLTAPANLTVNTGVGATACGTTIGDGALGSATASDNCSATVTRSGVPAGNFFPTGTTTLTYTATDPSGNSVSSTQTITVVDNTPPTIATANLTASTEAALCGAHVTLGTTATDNCGTPTLDCSRSDGAALASAFPTGTTTITWTATDAAGNTTTATQTVTVEDHENPILSAPANLTVHTGALATSCGTTVGDGAIGTATATDNCSATVERTGVPAGNFFPTGATTLTYTATDPSGNSVTATQTITVIDNTPPTITTTNLTASTEAGLCGANVTLGTTASDNCPGVGLNGTCSDGLTLASTFPTGTTTITWTATDAAGNTSTATQTVTVEDHENPVLSAPGNLTLNTGATATSCGLAVNDATLGTATATDNCSATVERTGVPAGGFFPVGETTLTYTATDPSGNSASATQKITIVDTTPPTIDAPAALHLATAAGATQCALLVSDATIGNASASDNCSANVTREGVPAGNLFPVGTTTITWTATDPAGNTATATQTVLVEDKTPPTIATAPITAQTAGSCGATVLDLGTTAADNCGPASLAGARSDGAALAAAFPTGTTTITWTATDAAGNTSNATQTVTVEDHENPVLTPPAAVTVNTGSDATACGAAIADASLGTATATDNCSATVTRSGVPAGGFFPVGTTTLTYTATDPSGNSVTGTQLVTVVDTTPPAISTGTLDVSTGDLTCTATIESLGTTAADNCGGMTLTGVRSDGAPLADPFSIGLTTIAWTATDAAGNTTTATQTVKVSDHQAPHLTPPPALSLETGAGAAQCGLMISDETLGTPEASDNCSMSVTRTGVPDGNLFPIGVTTVTWTATDPSGNATSGTQTVTVADKTPPSVTAPAALTVFTGPSATQCGVVVANAALGTATANDNCSATVARTGVPSDNLFPVGATTLTYTATDGSGNTATATQVVTVVDNTPPSITTANLNLATNADICGATVASLGTTATDNCSVSSLVGTRSDGAAIGAAFPLGTTTITWVATDPAGNTKNATQTVTVANPTPAVTIVSPASGALYAVGGSITMSGTFTDNTGDLHTARWVCDALAFPGTVNESAKTVTGTMSFTAAGVYCVRLEVTDQCGNTASSATIAGLQAMVVVYDPSAGFVTGGGWIDSPIGAYPAGPALTGKANFGFVSKYKKGQSTPTGETEFQFKAGDLNFHSTSYDWLVVSGAKAQFKGSGQIGGTGSYGFLLTSTDGQVSGGGGKDKFRIKITDKTTGVVVYDNQMGAADTASASCVLGGGSIVIQSQGGALAAASFTGGDAALADGASSTDAASGAIVADAIFQNAPNPFNPQTMVRFALAEAGRATVRIFNARGELTHTVVDGWFPAGAHTASWNGSTTAGGRAASGVYYAVLETARYRGQVRMILIK